MTTKTKTTKTKKRPNAAALKDRFGLVVVHGQPRSPRQAQMFICLDAGHDRSGNPRRVFVIFDDDGCIIDAIDDAYIGPKQVYDRYEELRSKVCVSFVTTPAMWRQVVKYHSAEALRGWGVARMGRT